jgi:two-component system sensor histidine kinase KdpD
MAMTDDNALRAELDRVTRRLQRERETRLEAEQIAERATRRLYESDRLKTSFLETVSHELRTPLASITGFADLLTRSWETLDDAARLDFLKRIRRNGAVLQTLIDQLLDFTRLDRDRFKPITARLSLSELVPETVEQLEVILERHRIRLDIAPDVTALADALAVTRILSNLLTNATNFSPEGSTVTIRATTRTQWAVLEVADEGPGVASEEQPLIFERFYRGRSDAAMRIHGTGLGLALVKELAEQMGGRVTVGDAESGGALFTVFLP